MIRFENLTKSFWIRGRQKVVIDNLNLTLPSGRSLGLLGRNGAGKSTLLQIIAGTMSADSGRIVSDGSISWPVGLAGAIHRELTGAENVKFLARIYGVDTEELIAFVQDFAELGDFFNMPVRSYSSGMRSRLAFGASMGIHFDTYLVDEVTAVGDARFKRKSQEVFKDRMSRSSAIVVNHSMPGLRQFCDSGLVLENGGVTYFEDLEEAITYHNDLMK
ncbi:ABC transporter ATP-binding protein [Roseovarius indicus]|uniref:ABC transporter ATP-binding protein n=1 Tax=Roseovarius indicus TaxID=540747 RepID=A0A0T5PDZ5_9RHOB|nr:ABC transporter ATP-binding protein [Roseovarius indicus]KRS19381.1 ABC transporter ATP-binding protein [Roseovarius indicus]QEW29315.1 Polysialic acid transport ATP-binding protein KpsT [Roseovarius indicus]SFD76270.1 capsular polysaccharide transport system ATP-binding protein [Roseovarius indicus]